MITSEELSEWEAFNRLEPIGGSQTGGISAPYLSRKEKPQSVEEMKQKIFQFFGRKQ